MGRHEDMLDGVGLLYEAAIGGVAWSEPLGRIADLLDGVFCTLEIVDKTSGSLTSYASTAEPDMDADYVAAFRTLNPRLQGPLPEGRIVTDYDVMDEALLDRHPFYAEFLAAYDMRYFAGLPLRHNRCELVAFSMQRNARQGHVQNGELAAISLLGPHLRRALVISDRLNGLARANAAMEEGLDALADGVALLDAGGRVRHANRAARDMFAACDGLTVEGGCVRAATVHDTAQLQATVAAAQTEDPLSPAPVEIMVRRPSGLPGYVVAAAAIRRPSIPGAARTDAETIVVIRDPANVMEPTHALLRASFGLTAAEAWLVLAIAAGNTPAAYAKRSGVKITTVRSQLSAALRKMQVDRQSDLVRLVTRLSGLIRR